MKPQWEEKVAKALKKKNQETWYAAMSEDKGRHSRSAAHPAYMGTSLCPDPRYRGGGKGLCRMLGNNRKEIGSERM